MMLDYSPEDDVLFISFSDDPIKEDISYGWNVNVGLTEHGIGQITILDAKADGLLPLQIPQKVWDLVGRTINNNGPFNNGPFKGIKRRNFSMLKLAHLPLTLRGVSVERVSGVALSCDPCLF